MAGATIANEIRAIAGGLAGKRLDAIQVRDLMIDTNTDRNRGGNTKRVSKRKGDNNNDRAAAESYYKAWSRSLDTKLKDVQGDKPKRVLPNRKRPTARRS